MQLGLPDTRLVLHPFCKMFDVCLLHTLTCKGVDRELFELTVSKVETSVSGSHVEDTLNRLMSTAGKTTSPVRSAQLLHPSTFNLSCLFYDHLSEQCNDTCQEQEGTARKPP